MSDSEIWVQTLAMEPESLAGLASLTKGALFEAHVAESTGGTLHEHFNNPDTDITIDGMEFQVKATDSAGYIESVDPEIPVIATSEVAVETGVIDGGMTNADWSKLIDHWDCRKFMSTPCQRAYASFARFGTVKVGQCRSVP